MQLNKLSVKHLLKMGDLTKQDILTILDLADSLKAENRAGKTHHILEGKTLGMIFMKSSTRTRVSFEVGIHQLGGKGLFLSANDLQLGRGEPIYDTAKVLSRYLDGIMIRTYAQSDPEDLAKYGSIPVINGLTDYAHPCQVLADFQTIREYKRTKTLDGLKLCFIGDGFNMANSLLTGGLISGMKVSVASPKGYMLSDDMRKFGESYGSNFTLTSDVKEAAKDADVLVTDVWYSMGQTDIEERKAGFKGFAIDAELLKIASKDAIVLHCLPAHRGEEISSEVFAAHENEIFDEAENRLHAQKAVMALLMS